MPTKTELEFNYGPSDYFEAILSLSLTHGEARIENGKVLYTLNTAIDPVPETLRQHAFNEVLAAFKLRELLTRRAFTLLPPSVNQHGMDGSAGRTLYVSGIESVSAAGHFDVVVRDKKGEVTHDSRAERIRMHADFITSMLPKMKNARLRAMIDSYCRSVDDSANELVHLFEVLEAASEHFGGDANARKAVGVSDKDWSTLGRLANHEPLKQGRHRGAHAPGLRDATPDELERARKTVRSIIEGFAKLV